jgi:FlaA1/EpsC-like NDP-sugar epimerase
MRNRTLLFGDIVFIIISVLGSFVLRVNLGARLIDFLFQILIMTAVAVIIKPLIYYRFGLYRRVWTYASIDEVKLIAIAVTTASIALGVILTLLSIIAPFKDYSRSVLFIDWSLSIIAVGGLRLSFRILAESQSKPQPGKSRKKRALIVGAGDAGALVVRELQKNPQGNISPICFVDDDPAKQKQEIHGVPVKGTLNDLADILETKQFDEVIYAIPSAPGQVVRKVADICRLKGISFRTIPSLNELIGGKISVNRLREVQITDLLRRAPATIDNDLVGLSLGGRTVLITGAGGSIGRELCRQVARWQPQEIILLGHGENSIFETLIELEQNFPSLPIHPVIADIRDIHRLSAIFDKHRPQVIFHAAAHKHLPLMQANIEEAVSNNVLGTKNVVENCIKYDVKRLVMISTDKAIRPTSIYGATKRIGEKIVLEAAHEAQRAYSVVRFGNVLGSRGSVLFLFKRQIDQGGPVTVTHPEMRRYFMTIPEAVHLVLQASAMGRGGEVFVLNMGEQIRILDLARDLIRLSGLEPDKDIEIIFTGIRPGEKLSEMLWDEGADYQRTAHPDILCLMQDEVTGGAPLHEAIEGLIDAAYCGDQEVIVQTLNNLIPGAEVSPTPAPDLTAII